MPIPIQFPAPTPSQKARLFDWARQYKQVPEGFACLAGESIAREYAEQNHIDYIEAEKFLRLLLENRKG